MLEQFQLVVTMVKKPTVADSYSSIWCTVVRKANLCPNGSFSVKCCQFLYEIFVLGITRNLKSLKDKCIEQERKKNGFNVGLKVNNIL